MRHFLIATATFAALLTGCASALKMPLQAEGDRIAATPGNTVYLMSVTLQNSCRDHYTPYLNVVEVMRNGGGAKPEVLSFAMDSKGAHYFDDRELPPRFLARFELAAGSWSVLGLSSSASGFPIRASFFTPLHAELPAASGNLVYLGAIDANVRERKGNEFKAGPSIPLIDQAVACASSGTFDVEIKDAFDADMVLFKENFPQLRSAPVTKAILPPFERAKAQKWWEEH
jgi:hypothetical protein